MINIVEQLKIEQERFSKSTSQEQAVDANSSGDIYDRLIQIGGLGNLRQHGHSDTFTDGPIPFYVGDIGSDPDDWREAGINEINPGQTVGGIDYPENDRSYYAFVLGDDMIDALDGKTIRIVAHYTGSFNCEKSKIDGTYDLFDKSSGSNKKGDVQVTHAIHESVGTSGVAPRRRYDWSQSTTASTVVSRAAKETPLETYKKQSWSTINALNSVSGSWVSGQFNKVVSSRFDGGGNFPPSPTSGTGALPKPQKYAHFATAYVDTSYGTEMWVRSDAFLFQNYTSNPSATAWDRIIISLGAHGDACSTLRAYIYVEPLANSLPNPTDTVAPDGPDLVSANIESDEATLTWEPVSASDLETYHVYYKHKGISETSFSSYEFLGVADSEGCRASYDLNSIYGISERYGDFQFKVLPQDDSANIGTGTEFPVKGQAEAISFVKSGTQIVSSGGQTLSITGIQANDLILISGTSDSQQVDAPTGFTELEDDDGSANPGAVIAYKVATGTSESITLTNQGGTGANQIIWSYQVFRNVSTSNPIETSASNHNQGSSKITLPSVTTSVDNCMIAVYGMIDDDGYASLNLPTGYTRTVMDATGTGLNSNFSTVVGGYKLEGTAGTYNPGEIDLTENDGRDGFTVALRPRAADYTTTLASFDSIYWQATLGSPTTEFLVTCDFDITNFDIPTSVFAYVTIDGTTPTTSNYDVFAELTDTTTGSDGSSWSSSGYPGFSSNSVSLNDEVKVLLVAINSKGDKNSEVVTLSIDNTGQNSTEWPDNPIELIASTTGTFMSGMASTTTLSGIQSGDFVVAILSENGTDGIPLASGWTNIRSGSSISAQRTAYIFATGTSVSWSISSSGSENGSIILAAFRNVNATTPIDVTSTSNTATSNSITPASITTTTNNCMILTAMSSGGGDITVTDPTGYTRVAKSTGGGFFNLSPGVGVLTYKTQISSGTESPGAFGLSTSRAARTVTIALRKV